MSEKNIDTIERENLFESGSISQDLDIPLEDMLADIKSGVNDDEPAKENIVEEPKEELTPLQKMRNSNKGYGMEVSNSDLEKGREKAPSQDHMMNERRMNEFQAELDEMDMMAKRREAVVILKVPTTQPEHMQLMHEIGCVEFDSNGKPFFNMVDNEGNKVEPVYCRIREEGEEINDFSTILNGGEKKAPPKQEKVNSDNEDSEIEELEEETEEQIDEETKSIVNVLIDKTGYGVDFKFTPEEREKIVESESIKIKEVKVVDINLLKSKRSTKSFQDVVKENTISGSRSTICFPASGFKAQMKGLTYGEYADISLSMENVTFDQYYKRLSIIYNKMCNVSTGDFEGFDDFLRHFAYTDIQLALYALFVATEQDDQEIQLRCGRDSCKKAFNWSYNTRSLLRLDRCAKTFLENMKKIATADPDQMDDIRNEAAVNNSINIELPYSHYVIEMGIASAYDFLYNFIPLMDQNTYKDAFGDDYNQVYLNNILLLTSIRTVYVPTEEDGEVSYIECTGYKDILDAIYNVSPEEIKIIAAYTAEFQSKYEMTFSFGDVVCPHCGNVTHNLDLTMDELVFQTYQRLMSTEIELPKIQNS